MTAPRLAELVRVPVVVAPMAGGPSTPELVLAAADAGALGFLAGGYKSASTMLAEIEAVRSATDWAFGVNVFVPGSPTSEEAALSDYLDSLARDAEALEVVPGTPSWDDDDWQAKIDVLLAHPPPVVSFTFGCPHAELVAALRAAGCVVLVTVTARDEAEAAISASVDGLCVQGPEAGAHRGTFSPVRTGEKDTDLIALIAELRALSDLPLLAAGGIMDARRVRAVLAAGALAVQCGTAFLRCPESGASALHKAALADERFDKTVVTRAFSGRPARGLVNRFILDHENAPVAYPEINNATRALRAAAGARGDLERMSLWAGTVYRAARDRPLREIVAALSA